MTGTQQKWDYLPPDWHAEVRPVEPVVGGALVEFLTAGVIWRALTRPQRELLVSTAAGAPIRARADVENRLFQRGLITAYNEITPAGRAVMRMRPEGESR